MTSFFQCAVCDYWCACAQPGDQREFNSTKNVMLEHYHYAHADMVTSGAFDGSPVTIADGMGPSFYDRDLSATYTWRQMTYWCRKPGGFKWSPPVTRRRLTLPSATTRKDSSYF